MSDDNKPEGNTKPAEQAVVAPPQTPKVWTDDEVQKIIEERQKAKDKLRKIDEDARKAEEAKLIEAGEFKSVIAKQTEELEQLRKFKESYDAEQNMIRDAALAKLSDDDKEIGKELSTPKLLAFVEKQTKPQAPFDGKGKPKEAENSLKAKPGESYEQWQRRANSVKVGGK